MKGPSSKKSLPLTLATYIAYGVGDFGPSMCVNIFGVYFFFFLTEIAGLPPGRAGLILLLGNGCNAIATLVVGPLSDRTTSRWGRRRVWMLASAPLLATSFALHWWIPPLSGGYLLAYYLVISVLFQVTVGTFMIPYVALLTDLTDSDREHLRLNGWRFGFTLGGSIVSLLAIEVLGYWWESPSQQFPVLGCICGFATALSIVWCCLQTQEKPRAGEDSSFSPAALGSAFRNRPLLFLTGIFSCSWMALQVTPTLLPYFCTVKLHLNIADVAMAILITKVVAMGALLVWEPFSQRFGKRLAFGVGIAIWIVANLGMSFLQPGDLIAIYIYAVVAGIGMTTAYLIPPAMLPETIDWEELQTGQRRDGLFSSILLFTNKIGIAISLFLFGQVLTISGFQESAIPYEQAESAVRGIELFAIYFPTFILFCALLLICFYPIDSSTREQNQMRLRQRRSPS